MKEKNIEKIAEKMEAIGKAKVEKDGKGKEYIVFDSDLLQCAQEVHVETLERDLLYIRDLMLMEAEEEENTFADDLRLRNAWLYANERIAWLQAKWEKIIPDIHVTVILREGGSGDMSDPNYVLPLIGMSEEIYKAASAFDKYIAKQTLHEAFRTEHAGSYVDEMNVGVDISENISASLSVVTPDATYMLLVCPDSDDDVIITAVNGRVVDEYHVGDIGEATRTMIRIAGKIA